MLWTIFKTKDNYYIYDRQENRIGNISQEIYQTLSECLGSGKHTEADENAITTLQKYGFCQENLLQKIEHPATQMLSEHLHKRMEQIILQVTQRCNLRCEYCVYSGTYGNRAHANRDMDFSTAKRAIDFLLENSQDNQRVTVGFYGGEPLLRFELIKEVVNYCEREYPAKDIHFAATTNGTLLSDDITNYLSQKNFSLMISIDGPKQMHDLHRCFQNGEGSFDVIKGNLLRLKLRNPKYYAGCSTNTVVSPDQDIHCIESFLGKDDVLNSIKSQMGLLSDTGLDNAAVYSTEVKMLQAEYKTKQLLELLQEYTSDKTSTLFGTYAIPLLQKYEVLIMGIQHFQSGHPGGPCVAGAKRAFIDIEGKIFPCEKVPECSAMEIGDVYTGFDIEKVSEIVNVAKITENECKNCWAFAFCSLCVATCIDSKGVSVQKRKSKCNAVRKNALDALREIKILEEFGCDFHKCFSPEGRDE